MKNLTLLVLSVLVSGMVWAQTDSSKDVIYKTDYEMVEAKIVEVSSSEVKYKEWDNPDGPVFVLKVSEIGKIRFSNGTEKVFHTVNQSANQPMNQSDASSSVSVPVQVPVQQPVQVSAEPSAGESIPFGFQMNMDLEGNLAFLNGYTIDRNVVSAHAIGGLSANIGLGVRIGQHVFAGIASGATGEWGNAKVRNDTISYRASVAAYIVPVYADCRVYAPSGTCSPFAEVGVGGYFGINGNLKSDAFGALPNKPDGGFYFISGVGVEFKYLTIGAGYKLMRNSSYIGNHGYIKIGLSFGHD